MKLPLLFRPRTGLMIVATLGLLSAPACMPTADGVAVDKQTKRAAKIAKKGGVPGRRRQSSNTGAAGVAFRAPSTNLADYVRRDGYIVKGTDFLTFWPCGVDGYYFMLPAPSVAGRIAQQYRLSAQRPYAPIYGQLRTRFVADTITVGTHLYSRYAEVIDYTALARADAKCSAPSRTTLSDEMRRLDNVRVVRR